MSSGPSFRAEALSALRDRHNLGAETLRRVLEGMLEGTWSELEITAFLVEMREKGETAEELAAAAQVLRDHMVRLDTGRTDVLDTCGTGGDASGTFNISTAAALVVAAAGVPVVKHGNRAQSSRSGSADVLLALGVNVEGAAVGTRECLERTEFAFCMAPRFHPALKQVAAARRRLGTSSIFNCLGPLANPAGAAYQLLGVGRREWLDRMAHALAQLGTRHALLVCGCDGLDEVTLSAPTLVREVAAGQVQEMEWQPEDFGLPECRREELTAADPQESAARIRAILEGEEGAAANIVLANAAGALLAAERAPNLREGMDLARQALGSGRALDVLRRLAAYSQEESRNDPPFVVK